MLTANQFQRATGISDELRDAWYESVVAAMKKHDINTPLRQAHFLAQVGHESGGFRYVEENLNYSDEALIAMFGHRMSREQARMYGRTSEHPANKRMIANIIYASRIGNGDIASGDGYRYRGRGLIQITGRANYAALVKPLGVDVVAEPHFLTGFKMAAESAAAWWKTHGLNERADADDVDRITRVINGGTIGIQDRKTRLTQAKGVLCSS